jgi:hypothetical protein
MCNLSCEVETSGYKCTRNWSDPRPGSSVVRVLGIYLEEWGGPGFKSRDGDFLFCSFVTLGQLGPIQLWLAHDTPLSVPRRPPLHHHHARICICTSDSGSSSNGSSSCSSSTHVTPHIPSQRCDALSKDGDSIHGAPFLISGNARSSSHRRHH